MQSTAFYEDKPMYVRFVVGADGADHRYLNGVISAACMLRDDNCLSQYESEWLGVIFDWFSHNVPVPPYSKNRWWPEDVAAWFKDDAPADVISKIWDVIALLREHGKNVRVLRSRDPGLVYYEDQVQIVVSEFSKRHSRHPDRITRG